MKTLTVNLILLQPYVVWPLLKQVYVLSRSKHMGQRNETEDIVMRDLAAGWEMEGVEEGRRLL